MGVPFLALFDLHFAQAVQDAAVVRVGPGRQAALAQFAELGLELRELRDARVDVSDMLVKQLVNGAAPCLMIVGQRQNGADLDERRMRLMPATP